MVAECGKEIDSKVNAASSVPVRLFENAEDLEPSAHMRYREPDPSEVAIARSLIVGEWVVLAGLLRRPGERVLVVNTLVPGVSEEFGVGMDGRLRLPQESKIMRRSATCGHAEDLAGDRMHQEL